MLRRVLLGAVAAIALAGPAAAEAFDWSGFYGGINGGYGFGQFRYPLTGSFTDSTGTYALDGLARLGSSGFLGGGQIGYNYVCPQGWLFGIETDADASSIGSTLHAHIDISGSGSADLTAGSKLEYLGTVRARVGYVIPQGVLVYATAGFAYGGVRSNLSLNVYDNTQAAILGVRATETRIDPGWTVGTGAEYPVSDHLTARAEYLYANLGGHAIASGPFAVASGSGSGSLRVGTAVNVFRVGMNYALN